MKLIKSKHYWLSGQGEKPTIVYYYFNPDAEVLGFGFNIADGGGFVSEDDLLEDSILEGPIEYNKQLQLTQKGDMRTKQITTNERFDSLTNLDISIYYRNSECYLMKGDFLGAFAYWVVSQSPYDTPNITKALEAFNIYIYARIKPGVPEKFTFQELKEFINEDVLESIPEIEKLNHPKIDTGQTMNFCSRYDIPHPDYDFIDLCVLGKNIVYMILRLAITQKNTQEQKQKYGTDN